MRFVYVSVGAPRSEAQRSGFPLERTNNEMERMPAARRAERNGVCENGVRHLFIINPAAGKRGTTAQLEALLEKLTFPHKPVLVLINYAPGLSLLMFQGNPQAMLLTSTTTHWNYLTWSGNSLSWYAGAVSGQMNSKDTTYYVVALLQMD